MGRERERKQQAHRKSRKALTEPTAAAVPVTANDGYVRAHRSCLGRWVSTWLDAGSIARRRKHRRSLLTTAARKAVAVTCIGSGHADVVC